jgi:hypothetical protein
MINDEFEDLLSAISEGLEGEVRPNPDDVILKTYKFFSKLKTELKTANDEEKKEIIHMIRKMQDKINEFSKKNCEKVGMTESELTRLADDTNLFNADQKRVLDMAKQDMMESCKSIRGHLSSKNIEQKEIKVGEKKKAKKSKKHRDDWMKS